MDSTASTGDPQSQSSSNAQNPQSAGSIGSGTPQSRIQPQVSTLQNASALDPSSTSQISLAPVIPATTKQAAPPAPQTSGFQVPVWLIVVVVIVVLSLVGWLFNSGDKTTTK